MSARQYRIAGRTFSKVSTDMPGRRPMVHVVELGYFWKGNKSWEHRSMCGDSISGVPVSLMRVDCPKCRAEVKKIQRVKE